MQIAECWGMPVWMCKTLCPSSEFTQWQSWFALKWTKYDRMSYEFGLTRCAILSAFGGKPKLEDEMLQNKLKEPPKDWEWLTDDEKAARIAKSKAAHGFKG